MKLKNRWLIALSGVCLHLCIGSVYAYSVMIIPLGDLWGWGKGDITIAFSIAIFFLGFSAAFLGRAVEKMGPGKSAKVSGLFYSLGILGTGLAVKIGSLPLFWICYGAIGGVGLGVGYITPVSTLVKWFPDRRGLATGMAIMGFGFASLIFSNVMAAMFQVMDMWLAFVLLSALYFCVIMAASLYIAPPPAGYTPKGFVPPHEVEQQSRKNRIKKDLAYMTANEALRTRRFYYIWIMLFINISCGIGMISVASPMAQELVGLETMIAAALVGYIGLSNGLGRILWASASDYIGRANTYMIFFIIQAAGYFALAHITHPMLFQVVLLLVITCYGGGFATLPAFLGDMFGTKQLGAVHGYVLTAWAMAGIVGPTIMTRVLDITGSYIGTIYIYSGMFAFAFLVSCAMYLELKKKRSAMELAEQQANQTDPKSSMPG